MTADTCIIILLIVNLFELDSIVREIRRLRESYELRNKEPKP